ncbi:MAG: twin-arginine translocation signal domain-containing protein [Xanthobacteraceae bacterium]
MKTQSKAVGRRDFLRVLGVGAGAAVTMPLGSEAKADSETNDEKRKARYQETDHVKKYYSVNRYPAKA